MTTPSHHPGPASAPAPAPDPVIDLRDAGTTRVRVARHDNPFTTMSPPERMRLIIRVLCELVAYDEQAPAQDEHRRRTIQAAMDATGGAPGVALPAELTPNHPSRGPATTTTAPPAEPLATHAEGIGRSVDATAGSGPARVWF